MSIDLIRETRPVENSVHNLIQTLSVKLDSAVRYRLYEEDAREDGFDDSAELFGRLEQQERDSIDELMRCLRDQLA
jgi:rubrerythrin